jgi:hypothetical protein
MTIQIRAAGQARLAAREAANPKATTSGAMTSITTWGMRNRLRKACRSAASGWSSHGRPSRRFHHGRVGVRTDCRGRRRVGEHEGMIGAPASSDQSPPKHLTESRRSARRSGGLNRRGAGQVARDSVIMGRAVRYRAHLVMPKSGKVSGPAPDSLSGPGVRWARCQSEGGAGHEWRSPTGGNPVA